MTATVIKRDRTKELPATVIHQLLRDMAEIKTLLQVKDMISEEEAAARWGVGVATMQTYVSNGIITSDMYTSIGEGKKKKRFYHESKLVGLTKSSPLKKAI